MEIAPDNTLYELTVSGEYASLGEMETIIMSKSVTIIDPIHPGEVLESEFLEPLGLSANKFV